MEKEKFSRLFPKGPKHSKERMRRFLANQMITMHKYSVEQTHQFVYQRIP